MSTPRAARPPRAAVFAAALLSLTVAPLPGRAEDAPGGGRRGRVVVDGPMSALSQLIGRPTDRSAVLSVSSLVDVEAYVEWTKAGGGEPGRTASRALAAATPTELELTGLRPDTAYTYRLRMRRPGQAAFLEGAPGTLRTQRAPGSTFRFCVQGDSHPERDGRMFDPALYVQTLRNVEGDGPDFFVLMGDDFSIDPLIARGGLTAAAVDAVYARQRTFLGVVGRTAALYLVNGNHEQAARAHLDGTATNPAVLAGRARLAHFPLPAPDAFYSGDAKEVEHVGLPRDYYAWTWGDALFVVLDPYWHSPVHVDADPGGGGKGGRKGGPEGGRGRDLWAVTLGEAQHRWLEKTLSESKARWKLVFSHHVLGTGRGGVERAPLYEWGGKDERGRDLFAEKRPGWSMPVHAMMVKHGVSVFFQGHDHLYARQELDGVVYQTVPNPADPTYTAFNREAYLSGDVQPNSGHLRVTVAPDALRVEYVRGVLPADGERAGAKNGDVTASWSLPARAAGSPR